VLARQVFPPTHTKQKNKKRPSDSTSPILVATGVNASTVKLIAGKITWAAGGTPDPNDTLELYEVADLSTEPTTPIATVTADLDQSAFDLGVLQHNNNSATFDEIRFGATFADVTPYRVLNVADAGSDWVTWSGEPVVPDAGAVNNNPDDEPLTIQWTADAVEGITVAFDPNADVEDPTAEA
jgi:hypothetical protein